MNNNSPVATPVNLAGVDPTFTGALPVVIVGSPIFSAPHDQYGGDPKVQSVIAGAPCMLDTLTGYNSDPSSAQLYVQLHEIDQLPIPPGNVPKVVIPVKGGKTPYSLSQKLTFSPGLAIGISTDEWTFVAAPAFLCWQCTYWTAP